jgi:hypothetical protein
VRRNEQNPRMQIEQSPISKEDMAISKKRLMATPIIAA